MPRGASRPRPLPAITPVFTPTRLPAVPLALAYQQLLPPVAPPQPVARPTPRTVAPGVSA
jgi:hypothetical protein